jgi:hypothetical protein
MPVLAVIKDFNKVKDGQAGFGPTFKGTPIDEFLFEGTPEAFHGGIVIAVAFTAHRETPEREKSFPMSGRNIMMS